MPEKYHVLLDEYQNVFFKGEKFFDFIEHLKLSETFTGFSGSPLNSTKRNCLKIVLKKHVLVLQLTPQTDLSYQETIMCKTQAQLIRELSRIADKFRFDAP